MKFNEIRALATPLADRLATQGNPSYEQSLSSLQENPISLSWIITREKQMPLGIILYWDR